MDKKSNAKIIQAVFSFLEAVHGKKDLGAISALLQGMIDELMLAGANNEEAGVKSDPIPWSRLDHDLRSPMNGILGFTEILLEELTDPDLKWKAEQIHISAVRMMKELDNCCIYRFSPSPGQDPSTQCTPEEPIAVKFPKPQIPVRKKAKSAGKKLPNVLIVEDNMVNSNLLQHHIRKYCHLFFSQTGNAAIEVARRENIDAIFMDINLGQGIDGTQAMLEIRKQIGNEQIPVIAVTGFAGREEREKFLEAGFTEFIAKPFEREEVISIVESLFKQED